MIYRSVGDARYFDTSTKRWYRQSTLDEFAFPCRAAIAVMNFIAYSSP